MKTYDGIYVFDGTIRRIKYEAIEEVEARRLAVQWGIGVDQESVSEMRSHVIPPVAMGRQEVLHSQRQWLPAQTGERRFGLGNLSDRKPGYLPPALLRHSLRGLPGGSFPRAPIRDLETVDECERRPSNRSIGGFGI